MKPTLLMILICLSLNVFASEDPSRMCSDKFCADVTLQEHGLTMSGLTWDEYEVSANMNMARLACQSFGQNYLIGSMVTGSVNADSQIAPITIVWMEGQIMLQSSRSLRRKVIKSLMCWVDKK